ncbi:MAG: hypothetical protein HPY57_15985 [Ignavibacteria bacterium]|nr:hypothetical protein [Ignavibacteria bacterium]
MITFIVIICISAGITGLAILLKNTKRIKEMKFDVGEVVNISSNIRIGKIIEDKGDYIRIEVEVPKHLVSKLK